MTQRIDLTRYEFDLLMHAKKQDEVVNRENAERVNAKLVRGQLDFFVNTYPKFFEAALRMWRERGGDPVVENVMLWWDANGAMWLEPDQVVCL